MQEIRALKSGSIERDGNLYSFNTVESTGWMTIVEQPKAVAYRPVRDLLDKITIPALWLIVVTAIAAWLAGRIARRQAEAARRIEREAMFNEKILANMPSVIAMVGELEASAGDSPEVRRALEVIRRNVELEARLIDDLLDVTRISKGKLQLSLETASVHEILQRSYEICREEIAAKDLKIEFRLRAEHAFVEGDPGRLQQVFWNLIKNSVKFTPAKGRIVIETLNPTPREVEVRTTDTGIGIEADQMERIFNAFEQGQSSITRRFGGLGLGLAISKAMVNAHGGTIRAESHGKNRGATFIVTLATVAAPAVAPAVPESRGPSGARVKAAPAKISGPTVRMIAGHVETVPGMM